MDKEEIKTREEKAKKCFVIMPISDVDGYPNGHFDRVYNHIITPACKQAGYDAFRADVTSKANVIIVDILRNALDCEMAICDLSARNPNVFYELGFRQAFDKKTVLMIDEKTVRPFDISAIRSFTYDSTLRIDLVDKAITDLVKALKATESMNETNSLLKLLAIESPAKLPEKKTISEDSSLILQAIRDMSEEMHNNFSRYRKSYISETSEKKYACSLLNGKIVSVGDRLYDDAIAKEIGVVMRITDDSIVVKNPEGNVDIITRNNPVLMNYSSTPF